MQYGSGAAVVTGVAGGALPFTGVSVAWIAIFGVMLILTGVAMFRISRIPTARNE